MLQIAVKTQCIFTTLGLTLPKFGPTSFFSLAWLHFLCFIFCWLKFFLLFYWHGNDIFYSLWRFFLWLADVSYPFLLSVQWSRFHVIPEQDNNILVYLWSLFKHLFTYLSSVCLSVCCVCLSVCPYRSMFCYTVDMRGQHGVVSSLCGFWITNSGEQGQGEHLQCWAIFACSSAHLVIPSFLASLSLWRPHQCFILDI